MHDSIDTIKIQKLKIKKKFKIEPDSMIDDFEFPSNFKNRLKNEHESISFKDFISKDAKPNIQKFRANSESEGEKKITVSTKLIKANSEYVPLNRVIMNGGGMGQFYR